MNETHDEITQRIADRLGERQRKMKRMNEMQSKPRRVALRGTAVMAIAASVVAAFLLFPQNNTAVSPLDELNIQPGFSEMYRAASPEVAEIEALISDGKFDVALNRVERALHNSDLVLKECGLLGEAVDDDELIYAYELEHVCNSELRWTYIFLLVRAQRTEDAIKQVRLYLKSKDYCEHESQARELLKILKNAKKI